jgi:hypothetical protein
MKNVAAAAAAAEGRKREGDSREGETNNIDLTLPKWSPSPSSSPPPLVTAGMFTRISV